MVWIPYSVIVETFQVLATVSDIHTLWCIRWCESVYYLNLVFGFCPLVQSWRRKEGNLHPCFFIVKFPWSIEVAHILLSFLTPSQWSLQVVTLTLQGQDDVSASHSVLSESTPVELGTWYRMAFAIREVQGRKGQFWFCCYLFLQYWTSTNKLPKRFFFWVPLIQPLGQRE